MEGILIITLLGISVISPMKEMRFHRWERTGTIQQVYSERTQDSLNVRLVGRWPYGTDYTVAVSKGCAYLGCGGVVFVLDIQDIKNPKKMAEITTPGVVRGLCISGDYLYVADGNSLRIIDISKPSEPKEVGYYNTSDYFIDISQISVYGSYAYVAASPFIGSEYNYDLLILDVSDPPNPKKVCVFSTRAYINDLCILGDYLYLANHEDGLCIFDISNPAEPREVGHYGIDQGWAELIHVSGPYAYLTFYIRQEEEIKNMIEIIDISDPFHPEKVGSYEIFARDIWSSGNYVYVVWGETLKVLDVSDPSNPQEVGSYDLFGSPTQISIIDSFAYVVCVDRLCILNVSDSTQPEKESMYNTPGGLNCVYACSSYVYTGGEDGLRIFDVSEPSNLREVGFDQGDPITSLWIVPPYAYETSPTSGLWIVDISDPSNPEKVGWYDTPGWAWDVSVSDARAYIADGYEGLQIIEVASPLSPRKIGFYDTPEFAWSLWIADHYAYIVDRDSGLITLDISTLRPQLRYRYPTEGSAWDVCVSGNLLFLQTGREGLIVFDVSNPSSPEKLGSYQYWGRGMYASGSFVYLNDVFEKLKVINIEDPLNLKEVGFYPLPFSSSGPIHNNIWTCKDYIYVVLADAGLFVLRYYGPEGREENPNPLPYPSFTISPNPAKENLQISYTLSKIDNITINLYDATGRLVKILEKEKKEAGTYNKIFDIDNLNPGVYFLRLEGKSMGKKTEKVIVM